MRCRTLLRPLSLIFLASLFSLLTACGFHLRGAADVPAEKQNVTLQTGSASSELTDSLKRTLRYNGITQTSNASQQIVIVSSRYKRRAATLSSRSEVDEYELSLEVSFHLADQEGNPTTSDIRLQQERVYTYNRNAAAASAEQERLLRQELHDAMAQSILRRYLATNSR